MQDFYVTFGVAFGCVTGLVFSLMLFREWRIRQTDRWIGVQHARAEATKEKYRAMTAAAQERFAAAEADRESARRDQELHHELERHKHAEQMRRRRDLVEIKAEKAGSDYHITLDAPNYHAETICAFSSEVEAAKTNLQSEYFRFLYKTTKRS